MNDHIVFYIWSPPCGGTSVWWDHPSIVSGLTLFGKWGSGWRPFGIADPETWAEGARATAAGHGLRARPVYGPPPSTPHTTKPERTPPPWTT